MEDLPGKPFSSSASARYIWTAGCHRKTELHLWSLYRGLHKLAEDRLAEDSRAWQREVQVTGLRRAEEAFHCSRLHNACGSNSQGYC